MDNGTQQAGNDNTKIKNIPWVLKIILRTISFRENFNDCLNHKNAQNYWIQSMKYDGMLHRKFFEGLYANYYSCKNNGYQYNPLEKFTVYNWFTS